MLNNILLVGFGGAAGSIVRFLFQRSLNLSFPYGTLLANLLGCFLIGIFLSFSTRHVLNENYRLLLMTGFCGGFTTFSAFTQEGLQLLMQNRITTFILYLSVSVVGGFLLTWLGYKLFGT